MIARVLRFIFRQREPLATRWQRFQDKYKGKGLL